MTIGRVGESNELNPFEGYFRAFLPSFISKFISALFSL